MRIAVVGAGGRMGRQLIRAVLDAPGVSLSGAIEREGSPVIGEDAGVLAGLGPCGVKVTSDALDLFVRSEAVLDFTAPEATLHFAELCAQARIVHIIGTTGLDGEDEMKLKAAARHARIVKSGNMSLGVNLLAVLVEKAARALADFDIEIVEMHHKAKVDAPSGTALLIGKAAAKGRDIALEDVAVMAREGHTGPRPDGAIGFATLRGGTVIGEHKLILAGPHERIELSHIAEDRGIFANGAVKAALWAFDKKPGLYSMADVLGLSD